MQRLALRLLRETMLATKTSKDHKMTQTLEELTAAQKRIDDQLAEQKKQMAAYELPLFEDAEKLVAEIEALPQMERLRDLIAKLPESMARTNLENLAMMAGLVRGGNANVVTGLQAALAPPAMPPEAPVLPVAPAPGA